MNQRILRRTRVHTALHTMPNVARHFYDGFHVGLKVEEPPFSSVAPTRGRK